MSESRPRLSSQETTAARKESTPRDLNESLFIKPMTNMMQARAAAPSPTSIPRMAMAWDALSQSGKEEKHKWKKKQFYNNGYRRDYMLRGVKDIERQNKQLNCIDLRKGCLNLNGSKDHGRKKIHKWHLEYQIFLFFLRSKEVSV